MLLVPADLLRVLRLGGGEKASCVCVDEAAVVVDEVVAADDVEAADVEATDVVAVDEVVAADDVVALLL